MFVSSHDEYKWLRISSYLLTRRKPMANRWGVALNMLRDPQGAAFRNMTLIDSQAPSTYLIELRHVHDSISNMVASRHSIIRNSYLTESGFTDRRPFSQLPGQVKSRARISSGRFYRGPTLCWRLCFNLRYPHEPESSCYCSLRPLVATVTLQHWPKWQSRMKNCLLA